jgi:hypothetical protein
MNINSDDFNTNIPLRTETEKADDIKEKVMNILSFCMKKENSILRNKNINEYKQLCMKTFEDFHLNYPTLFFLIIENPSSFPIYRLNELLNYKKKIENNEIDEKKISVHIGQKYYNEFVKDKIK